MSGWDPHLNPLIQHFNYTRKRFLRQIMLHLCIFYKTGFCSLNIISRKSE